VSLKKGKKPNTLNETGEGLPYCTAKYLRTNEIESVVPESKISKAFVIDDADIIILWDGSNAGEMLRGKKGVLASTMCKLALKDKSFNMDFIFQFLRFRSNDIRRATVGSAIPHVDPGMIENIEIPVLEMKKQKSIGALFNNILSNINLLESKILASQSLQKSLINQIF
jgi:type I restriction enzyme S subunit